jgi:hypothetical protein
VRFYLDEDLSPEVARIARARGLDVVSAHELGHRRAPDRDILATAARDGRCVVTRNRDDLIAFTLSFFEQQLPHAGVPIVPYSLPNDDFAGIARALVRYVQRPQGGIAAYTLDFLSAT